MSRLLMQNRERNFSVSDGVTILIAWSIKPERADAFVEALVAMFPVTRTHPGFRSIQLIPGHAKQTGEPRDFLLIEEWDEAQNFEDYGKFRLETGDTAMLLEMTTSYPQVTIWSSAPLGRA
jgi:quinol monooxygenase YgiN